MWNSYKLINIYYKNIRQFFSYFLKLKPNCLLVVFSQTKHRFISSHFRLRFTLDSTVPTATTAVTVIYLLNLFLLLFCVFLAYQEGTTRSPQ